MPTPTTTDPRLDAAVERLAIDPDMAALVISRDVAACEVVLAAKAAEHEQHTCPEPAEGEWAMACEHLRRLWMARDYHQLAVHGAPTTGAWPCDCRDGKFYSGGAVVNGTYTGKVGTCFRCNGKAWQDAADRKRNANYDRYHRRIPSA